MLLLVVVVVVPLVMALIVARYDVAGGPTSGAALPARTRPVMFAVASPRFEVNRDIAASPLDEAVLVLLPTMPATLATALPTAAEGPELLLTTVTSVPTLPVAS